MSQTRIAAHHERCIGAGNCVEIAEKYFDQDDANGTVIVLQDVAAPGDESLVSQAIDICPVAALYSA